ncbi:MAG: CvpA family protein [Roseobacter sp.]
MENFTVIDGVVGLIVLVSALLAYGRGIVREIMAIVGWVAAAILGFMFAPQVEPMVREVPVIGEFLADSCELSIIGAFAAVFAVALIIVSLFTPLFSSAIQRSALSGIDQGLGLLFGVARGVLLVAVGFFVYNTVITGDSYTIVDESRSAAVFSQLTGEIENAEPEQALGWITGQYEALVGNCGQ